MFDIYTVFALGGIVLLIFVGRKVADVLTKRESASSWYKENVGTEYVLDFPDKERESFDVLQEKIRSKYDADKTNDEWHRKCSDSEVNVQLIALKNVLVKSISNLAQLQKDRPGAYKLWRGKLISESYWESLQLCEEEVKEDISQTLKQANQLKPGIGDTFFDDCLNVFRKQKEDERKDEARQQLIEQRKLEEQNKKQAAEKAVVDAKKQEKEREKMMQQLIMEEERELAREKKTAKKRNTRAKKG